jgi:hypothetical protein
MSGDAKSNNNNKIVHDMKRLERCFNPSEIRFITNATSRRESVIDLADVAFKMIENVEELYTFEEDYNHHDLNIRTNWREAIERRLSK